MLVPISEVYMYVYTGYTAIYCILNATNICISFCSTFSEIYILNLLYAAAMEQLFFFLSYFHFSFDQSIYVTKFTLVQFLQSLYEYSYLFYQTMFLL